MTPDSSWYSSEEFLNVLRSANDILLLHQWKVQANTSLYLRKQYPHLEVDIIHSVLEIAIANHKATLSKEYDSIQPWIFTKQTFEQCSSPAICLHHMHRLQCKAKTIVEVCTGSGMDSLAALMLGAANVYTFEKEKTIAHIAQANFSNHGLNINITIGDAEKAEIPNADIFWADPSRREFKEQRTSLTGRYAPDLPWLIQKAATYSRAGIKIAPGEDVKGNFSSEFIGFGKECREQILWFHCDIADGTVTLIDKGITFSPAAFNEPSIIDINNIVPSMILVEPHPALIRGALSAFYAEHEIKVFDRSIAYGIVDSSCTESAFYTRFRIIDIQKFNRKSLQLFINTHQWNAETEIKKRGFPQLPEEIRSKLQFVKGSSHKGVIILTRCGDEHYMVCCERQIDRNN